VLETGLRDQSIRAFAPKPEEPPREVSIVLSGPTVPAPGQVRLLGRGAALGRGDAACHQQAEKDGYVAVSLYAFCRREEVHTVPRPAGAALLVALLTVVGVVLWRVRRARTF
jgi:hypothetical protein